jgi:hypothetical protein
MTFGSRGARGADGEVPDYRAIAWLLVAAGGLAACITFLVLGMRAVMDIGGSCASGGPFVSVQPCPDGVPAAMVVGTLGLFGFGGLGLWAGARIGGGWAALPLLAWPGLFLSLGWNFLEYGIWPPGDEPGPAIGWLVCGVVFVLMGAVPLWIAISARNELREGDGLAVATRFGMGDLRSAGARPGSRGGASAAAEAGSGAIVDQGGGPARAAGGGPGRAEGGGPGRAEGGGRDPDFVARLERLAELRRSGDLTDEEFDIAKRRLLAGDR